MSFFFFSVNDENLLDFEENNNTLLTGEVISVGDGIVYVSGLEDLGSGAVVNIYVLGGIVEMTQQCLYFFTL